MNYLYSNSYLGICLRSNSNQDSSQNQSTRVSNINDNSVSKWHLWSCTCTSRMGRRTPIAPLARGIFIYKNKRFWKDGFFSTPTKKYLLYSLLPRVFQWGMACFLIKHLSSFQILLEKSMQHPKFTWWYSWPIPNPLLRRDFSVRLAMYTEDAGHVMQGDRGKLASTSCFTQSQHCGWIPPAQTLISTPSLTLSISSFFQLQLQIFHCWKDLRQMALSAGFSLDQIPQLWAPFQVIHILVIHYQAQGLVAISLEKLEGWNKESGDIISSPNPPPLMTELLGGNLACPQEFLCLEVASSWAHC